MSSPELRLITPRSQDWGAFDCGDERINAKLRQEVRRAEAGLHRLYGSFDGDNLVGVMTVRAGVLSAPLGILAVLGVGIPEVPTLHIEVLATLKSRQRQGHGQVLLLGAVRLARQLSADIGLKTVSLEAPQESRAFYQAQGFESATSPWPDGSWPMWVVLD